MTDNAQIFSQKKVKKSKGLKAYTVVIVGETGGGSRGGRGSTWRGEDRGVEAKLGAMREHVDKKTL